MPDDDWRIGSLCSGAGGLDLAVQEVFGGRTVWHCEPAPGPTEPNTKGNPRLNPAFSEWMQGWPAGWVTAVPGISRNDMLRLIGNGVCVQQGVAALRWLLDIGADS